MMTNRELLELAARAMNREPVWLDHETEKCWLEYTPSKPLWNPLKNNADAFALSIELGITVHQYSSCVSARSRYIPKELFEEDYAWDRFAATRRAIVLCAAAVGKDKEKRKYHQSLAS